MKWFLALVAALVLLTWVADANVKKEIKEVRKALKHRSSKKAMYKKMEAKYKAASTRQKEKYDKLAKKYLKKYHAQLKHSRLAKKLERLAEKSLKLHKKHAALSKKHSKKAKAHRAAAAGYLKKMEFYKKVSAKYYKPYKALREIAHEWFHRPYGHYHQLYEKYKKLYKEHSKEAAKHEKLAKQHAKEAKKHLAAHKKHKAAHKAHTAKAKKAKKEAEELKKKRKAAHKKHLEHKKKAGEAKKHAAKHHAAAVRLRKKLNELLKLPKGSYRKTCKKCEKGKKKLSCSCRKINGKYRSTAIVVGKCDNFHNINGVLKKDKSCLPKPKLPGGSYARSCKSCKRLGNELKCTCRKRNGRYRGTAIAINKCNKFHNIDGVLKRDATCRKKLPGGSYSRSCYGCKVGRGELSCKCRKINGKFKRTVIGLGFCKVFHNINGNLKKDGKCALYGTLADINEYATTEELEAEEQMLATMSADEMPYEADDVATEAEVQGEQAMLAELSLSDADFATDDEVAEEQAMIEQLEQQEVADDEAFVDADSSDEGSLESSLEGEQSEDLGEEGLDGNSDVEAPVEQQDDATLVEDDAEVDEITEE